MARTDLIKYSILPIVLLISSKIFLLNAQDTYGLYETIDSTSRFGVKEIMIKISNNSVELYTLPNAYNIGIITANKGRFVNEENSLYYQIDSTWTFSSNSGYLRKLGINCLPKIKVVFNQDSTIMNLKLLSKSKSNESLNIDSSKYKYRMICSCIEDYQELELQKVEYFQNEFYWNCGSNKNWKRQLTNAKTINCSNQSELKTK